MKEEDITTFGGGKGEGDDSKKTSSRIEKMKKRKYQKHEGKIKLGNKNLTRNQYF